MRFMSGYTITGNNAVNPRITLFTHKHTTDAFTHSCIAETSVKKST